MRRCNETGTVDPAEKSTPRNDEAETASLAERLEALGRAVDRVGNDPGTGPAESQRDFAEWQLDVRRSLALLKGQLAVADGARRSAGGSGRELRTLVSRVEQEFELARVRFGF